MFPHKTGWLRLLGKAEDEEETGLTKREETRRPADMWEPREPKEDTGRDSQGRAGEEGSACEREQRLGALSLGDPPQVFILPLGGPVRVDRCRG